MGRKGQDKGKNLLMADEEERTDRTVRVYVVMGSGGEKFVLNQ